MTPRIIAVSWRWTTWICTQIPSTFLKWQCDIEEPKPSCH